MHFRKGTKGPKLILGGYSYFKNNSSHGRTYWLCSRNRYGKCKARIITINQTRQIIIKNQMHNHEQEPISEIESLEVIPFSVMLEYFKDCAKYEK